MHNNHATYRAKSFLVESNESSMVYEVKRTRATWDPSLAIPGTDRRGGWRCPVGTRYGGQITDRFGRNCGWGVARRLSNTISNIGERLENVDDRRRGRRVARRNERMVRQLREGGRIERAARRVADVLETEDTRSSDRNIIEPPRAPRAPRRQRGALRMSEERRMRREIDQPNAPRTGEVAPEPRPIAPRVRRQTANRNRGVNRPVPQPAPEPEMIQPPKKAAAKKAAAKKVPAKKVPAKKVAAKKRVAKKVPAKKATAPRAATPRPATPQAAQPNQPVQEVVNPAPTRTRVMPNIPLDFNYIAVLQDLQENRRIGADRERQLGYDADGLQRIRQDGIDSAARRLRTLEQELRDGRGDEQGVRGAIASWQGLLNNGADTSYSDAQVLARSIQDRIQRMKADNKSDEEIRNEIAEDQRRLQRLITSFLEKRNEANALGDPARINNVLMALPPRPVEDLAPAEVIRAAQQRIDKAINDRQDILGEYLNGRYGEGQAPWLEMTQDRFAELARKSDDGDADARLELKRWAEAMYSHELIRGSNGKNYAIVAEARIGNGISISANIYYVNPDGNRQLIGDSSRTISLRGEQVSNNHMKIRVATHKNAGIQTIYNQHAFMYAKAAGFKRFSVSAVDDGPYVWGRVGFRQPVWGEHIANMRNELNQFRNGRQSLIKSEDDANIIDFLLAKYDRAVRSGRPQEQPRHMDFIYAISNNERRGSQAYKTREADLKRWFLLRMPFSSGMFDLEENKISADPRRRAQ